VGPSHVRSTPAPRHRTPHSATAARFALLPLLSWSSALCRLSCAESSTLAARAPALPHRTARAQGCRVATSFAWPASSPCVANVAEREAALSCPSIHWRVLRAVGPPSAHPPVALHDLTCAQPEAQHAATPSALLPLSLTRRPARRRPLCLAAAAAAAALPASCRRARRKHGRAVGSSGSRR